MDWMMWRVVVDVRGLQSIDVVPGLNTAALLSCHLTVSSGTRT